MARNRDKTAAYRLFHYRYNMVIPRSFLYGKAYLEKHGYHVSGDAMLDQARLMEPEIVRQTPAGLAMLHAEGCAIEIVDKKESVVIYEDIQEHLLDWERLATQGVHPNDAPPIEDFRQLEAVAMALYPTAKFYEPAEQTGDLLRDRLMNMNRRRQPGRTERQLRSKITNENGDLKPYVSIVDRIERELIGSMKQWQ